MDASNVSQYSQKHEEDLKRLKNFRLLDDDFCTKVFEDIECVELLLRIILKKDNLKVTEVHSQYNMKNLHGRSARLDIYAVDDTDAVLNVEVQRSDRGAVPKRARYHSSLIDANVTEPGDKYEKLPESYVIFITEHDIMGAGLPLYHINRFVEETGNNFGDDSHIIYVNSQIQDGTALGRLMHDFSCTDPSDMNYKILADRVRFFKSDKEGVLTMCQMLEEMRNETALETTKEFALRLIIRGKDTLEEIAEITLKRDKENIMTDSKKEKPCPFKLGTSPISVCAPYPLPLPSDAQASRSAWQSLPVSAEVLPIRTLCPSSFCSYFYSRQ